MHHLILAKVKALQICNGLDKKETRNSHFIVERKHQLGSESEETRVHAIDCNIVIYGRGGHCTKCEAIRYIPKQYCLAGLCEHGLFLSQTLSYFCVSNYNIFCSR